MTLYRAADSPEIREGDCLTDDLAVAREYATQRGYAAVYAVEISEDGDWASAADVARVATSLYGADRGYCGLYAGAGETWGDLDQMDVREALRAERNVAVEFEEPWGSDHGVQWTLRLLDVSIITSIIEE